MGHFNLGNLTEKPVFTIRRWGIANGKKSLSGLNVRIQTEFAILKQ